jgi:TRAP-type C4-dicarboxylate transport system permease small subunit
MRRHGDLVLRASRPPDNIAALRHLAARRRPASPANLVSGLGSMSEGGGIAPRSFIDRVFWYAGAALMLAMTGTMLYVVTARYFFNRPPLWSEDVPRTIFVWMVFVTLGLAIKLGLNIRVTSLVDLLPRNARFAIEVVMHVLVLGMIAVLVWFTIPILQLKAQNRMLSTGWSEAVLVVPMLVGFCLAGLHQALRLARAVTAWRNGAQSEDGAHAGAGMG